LQDLGVYKDPQDREDFKDQEDRREFQDIQEHWDLGVQEDFKEQL
jgi:hypothetical protein